MGQVYRATDARLKRDIAIKVLPDEWAHDADRVARFHREAELLAALNHSNVAAVYGFEEYGNVKALLMELVEGPTLADRILHGPMAPDQALAIARQIADALDAAHERGIIHRDLKPANIKVRQDGTVKVLDFGLAKATTTSTDLGALTTMTVPEITSSGVIVGTPAYMSPEQARGQGSDKRTDIWAFGCALYEMLSGRAAFRGATVTDTLVSILERDPDWTALPPATPSGLVRLIERCVDKDVKRRLRDIGDARAELDAVQTKAPPPDVTAGRPAWQRGWGAGAGAAALAAVSVAVTLLVQHSFAGGATPTTEDTSPAPDIVQATADEGVTADPALSNDGAMLAYASDRAAMNNLDIWVQQTAGSSPLQVTRDPVDELEPSFSPDGSRLAYRSERDGGGIYIVPTLGGQEPRLLVAGGRRPRFSPDGQFIAYWTGSNVGFTPNAGSYRTFVIRVDGGTAREIEGFSGVRYPVWAPDGRELLVLGSRDTRPLQETYDWWRVSLNEGSRPTSMGAKALLAGAGINFGQGNVHPDAWRGERVLFSDGRYLWSAHLGAGTPALTAVDRLTFGTNQEFQVAIASSGMIAFASASVSNVVWSLPIDAVRGVVTGLPRRVTPGAGMNGRPSATDDGRQVAYRTAIPRPSIVVRDLSTAKEIDTGIAGSGFGPALSPDGSSVAFEDAEGVSVVATRGGSPRRLCQSCTIGAWTGDSTALVVVKPENNAGRLARIGVADGRMQDLIVSPDEAVSRPFPSPNGRLLAFRRSSSGDAVMVAPLTELPVPRAAWIQIAAPETDARPAGWSPDGSLLYFVSARDGARCLWAQRVDRTTGKVEGEPFLVQHFHGGRNVYRQGLNVLSTGPGNAITGGAFFYDLSDLSSNIWLMPAPQGRR
jgi:serine/threonine protein kinase